MGIPTSLTKIVDRAIERFQTKHSNAVISNSARAMLVDHAQKNKKPILADLKQRKTTQKGLTKGLEEVLGQAGRLQERREVPSRARPQMRSINGRVARERAAGRFLSGKFEISSRAVRAAMKKKRKTFPWC